MDARLNAGGLDSVGVTLKLFAMMQVELDFPMSYAITATSGQIK